jgi:hypothetical protein
LNTHFKTNTRSGRLAAPLQQEAAWQNALQEEALSPMETALARRLDLPGVYGYVTRMLVL